MWCRAIRKPIEIYQTLSNDELIKTIKRSLKVKTILIVAECEIFYEGRAASYAESQVRLIIIKADGTILIHEKEGRDPLNWQPSNSLITVEKEEGKVTIISKRLRPKELLKVILHKVFIITLASLGKTRLKVLGSEEDMINYVALNPSIIEEGATLVSREVRTPHGRIDLILKDKNNYLIIVEFKRSIADVDAAYQLKRYVEYYLRLGMKVKGVLAAPGISPQAHMLLNKFGFKFVKILPPLKKL